MCFGEETRFIAVKFSAREPFTCFTEIHNFMKQPVFIISWLTLFIDLAVYKS